MVLLEVVALGRQEKHAIFLKYTKVNASMIADVNKIA